jgi:hypothetical protein
MLSCCFVRDGVSVVAICSFGAEKNVSVGVCLALCSQALIFPMTGDQTKKEIRMTGCTGSGCSIDRCFGRGEGTAAMSFSFTDFAQNQAK